MVGASLALLLHAVATGANLDAGGNPFNFGFGFVRVTFSFFLGVLICRFYRNRSAHIDTNWIHRLAPVAITLALILILSAPLSSMHSEGFRFIAIVLCFPAMVYYGALARLPRKLTYLATALGELSYPLYLLHMPFMDLLRGRRLSHFGATHTALARVFAPCAIAIFAFISWKAGQHIDLPIRRALTRRYNSYKQATLAPIQSQALTPELRSAQRDDA
jgi:peptidoglycan/LPS O-acetylase OafA/YrhL